MRFQCSCTSQRCAQVLLTLDNLANRGQYINARNTFTELLAYGAIPVVNENVSTEHVTTSVSMSMHGHSMAVNQ